MRFKILILLFFYFIIMGILGFAPIHLHEQFDDKLLHFFIFFNLGILLYFLWNLASVKRNLILATILLSVTAIGSECIQGLLPYRTFDVNDMIANMLGGGLGLGLSSLLDYVIEKRKENKRRFGGKREAEYQRALMEFTDEEEEQENLEGSFMLNNRT
ncbi:VanZ like family-domain-containing protein [Cokeromyces recurvatus]|uniref:VanZ like family-domain-containing protein n=1 Tax=Cokeromyces recurvatus TaxID=90255 RepID=UPI00221EE47F|nr:VanZ like family-domain-containing protein [Cokeromyces recurvatus]KAI7901243.1 VanZ like family-domain-containing protein [Cokeromyces recurvatus]